MKFGGACVNVSMILASFVHWKSYLCVEATGSWNNAQLILRSWIKKKNPSTVGSLIGSGYFFIAESCQNQNKIKKCTE